MKSRYIPAGSAKVCDKHSDAVAYIWTGKSGKPCAMVYFGKQSQPVANYRYDSETHRAKRVAELFASRQASLRAKAEHATKRKAPTTLEIGDILSTCWGYEQTNREFYEITAVSGRSVTICQIAAESVETAYMQGKCVPQSGSFIGEPMRKIVSYGDSVRISSCIVATKWNTGRVAGVPVGPALSWSSYA